MNPKTLSCKEVLNAEKREILRRREVIERSLECDHEKKANETAIDDNEQKYDCGETSDGNYTPIEDSVGLALSGGGMRSACFGLGIVQGFVKAKIWRFVDYMSTVSGGGFIGARITSEATNHETDTPPVIQLDEQQGIDKNSFVKKLTYGGQFLNKPAQLFNKYLIGIVLINVAIFAALIAGCATVAYLWRMLDEPWIRNQLNVWLIGVKSDLVVPFIPAVVFGFLWGISWFLSYFQNGAEASGRAARAFLLLSFFSILVGIALLLGNGDLGNPFAYTLEFESSASSIPKSIWTIFIAAVIGALIPLVRPKRWLKSGLRPKAWWEKSVFSITSTALLIGVPLLIIGFVGKEDISGTHSNPARPISSYDVNDNSWSMLAGFIASGKGCCNPSGEQLHKRLLGFVGPDEKSVPPKPEPSNNSAPSASDDSSEYSRFGKEMRSNAENVSKKIKVLVEKEKGVKKLWVTTRIYYSLASALSSDVNYSNPVKDYLEAKKELVKSAELLTRKLERRFVAPENPINSLVLTKDQDKATKALAQNLAAWEYLPKAQRRRVYKELINLELPGVFREPSPQRRFVILDDQATRRYIVFLFGVIGFIGFCLVDLNATSMHRFYRNKLSQMFIQGVDSERSTSPTLKETNPCEFGAPYHLINAKVSFMDFPWKKTAFTPDPDITNNPGDDLFLFSHLACGSEKTGYVRPHQFQSQMHNLNGRIDLAEAIALSGAALSPTYHRQFLFSVLTFLLNFRLGQWLPTPGTGRHWYWPSLLSIIFDGHRSRKRNYCFISDGGHTENLGLLPLFQRRCRIIFCVDAGADDKGTLSELARVKRIANLHYGIDFISLDTNSDLQMQEMESVVATKTLAETDADHNDTSDLDAEAKTARLSESHFAVFGIKYPSSDGSNSKCKQGLLIYVKPSLTGDEPLDVLEFAKTNDHFPHDPTGDQFFEPNQVESYRKLGLHTVEMLQKVWERNDSMDASEVMNKLLEKLKDDNLVDVLELFREEQDETEKRSQKQHTQKKKQTKKVHKKQPVKNLATKNPR